MVGAGIRHRCRVMFIHVMASSMEGRLLCWAMTVTLWHFCDECDGEISIGIPGRAYDSSPFTGIDGRHVALGRLRGRRDR